MASRGIRSATPSRAPERRSAWPDSATAPPPASLPELVQSLVAFGEALAYSSGLAALVGGAMTLAVGRALASPSVPRAAALVACGAFVIYNVDRLRAVAHDGPSSPRRTAFVIHHGRALRWATGAAALALIALIATAPAASVVLCLSVGSIGLLHRRLKQDARFKVAYVAAAWTAACVGIPWLAHVGAHAGGGSGGGDDGAVRGALAWALLIVGSAVTANLIASNLRDGKRSAAGWPPDAALVVARGVAIAGVSLAAFAPEHLIRLAWIPAAEAASLSFFHPSERFGHLAVDGALFLGALFAICSSNG